MATRFGTRVTVEGLSVSSVLFDFVRHEAIPGSQVDESAFWLGVSHVVRQFTPRIRELVEQRSILQARIDEYHRSRVGQPHDPAAYESYLRSIGYLVDEPDDFSITTSGADLELTSISGPQLVVPLLNARFAVNAANARWGSLFDALYGSNVIDENEGRERSPSYNPVRGAAVVERARAFLDQSIPLAGASHGEADRYTLVDGALSVHTSRGEVGLADPSQLIGYQGSPHDPSALLFTHHGLQVEIHVDRSHPVGSADPAGIKDVVLEAAVTTIMDLEDSIAAVDVHDKVAAYRNWLHLMQDRLEAEVTKGERTFTRRLAPARMFRSAADDAVVTLSGRSVLLIRHVGHLMTSDAILDADGRPVPEGVLDALITGLCSLHDLRGPARGNNSRSGSVYVVKPKMHGPDEVAVTCELLARTEEVLGMSPRTIKLGIMDEERRTSANLKACIHRARDRVVFINTGFLDRTGDEIHTSMHAGPVVRKAQMKTQHWFTAYEDLNVDIGLECGFRGRAQIGKGMWAAPDDLAAMLAQKAAHPTAGANCAWVPSPTAATLHAMHYHQVDVADRQRQLSLGRRHSLTDLLTIPLGDPTDWDDVARREELDNNVQSTLGYVVRWVNDGVGCSKVPDLYGTSLMEDRATCRISSQHVSNWLHHDVIGAADVESALRRMAVVVDEQNASDARYVPLAPGFDSEAFQAARDLLLKGMAQPSGYTEPTLHLRRAAVKRHLENRDTLR